MPGSLPAPAGEYWPDWIKEKLLGQNNVVSVRTYGANGDPRQNPEQVRQAFQTAVDLISSRGGGTVLIPSGHYVLTEGIYPREPYAAAAVRTGGITFLGENMYSTTIEYLGSGYCFDFTVNGNSFDAVDFIDFNIDTATGGGIKFPQGGQINFHRYWANGAAPDKWAIYMDGKINGGYGVYMVDFSQCRFWRSEDRGGFLGRVLYINDYHTVNMRGVFMSQQRYDGSVIVYQDGKNAKFDGVAFEGMSSATTKQALIEFKGFNTNVTFDSLYLEGWWNIGVKLTDPEYDGAQKNFTFNNIYAWCYGRNDAQVMVAGPNEQVTINGLTYKSDSTTESAANQYIVWDPNLCVKLNGFNNNSPTQQQKFRPIKQGSTYTEGSTYMIVDRGDVQPGGVVPASFNLPGDGKYLVSIVAESYDRNHGRLATFFVTVDHGLNTGYGFHDVQEFGTQVLKNEATWAPEKITLSVDENGLVSLGFTVPQLVEAPGWRVNYAALLIGEIK